MSAWCSCYNVDHFTCEEIRIADEIIEKMLPTDEAISGYALGRTYVKGATAAEWEAAVRRYVEDIREEDEEGRDASATEQFLKEYF